MQIGLWIDIGDWVWVCVWGGGGGGYFSPVGFWRQGIRALQGGGDSPTLCQSTHPSQQIKKIPLQEK